MSGSASLPPLGFASTRAPLTRKGPCLTLVTLVTSSSGSEQGPPAPTLSGLGSADERVKRVSKGNDENSMVESDVATVDCSTVRMIWDEVEKKERVDHGSQRRRFGNVMS